MRCIFRWNDELKTGGEIHNSLRKGSFTRRVSCTSEANKENSQERDRPDPHCLIVGQWFPEEKRWQKNFKFFEQFFVCFAGFSVSVENWCNVATVQELYV